MVMCFGVLRADVFFFSSRRRHTIFDCDWSSDVCSSDLFADRLYAEANRLVIHSTVVATMVGTIAGYVIAAVTHVQTIGFVLVCAVVAGGMGYVRGREKAFTLKMQAQQVLCLMSTERNTRFVEIGRASCRERV